MESFQSDRASLPRNMIENSMFEEEPDVVDLAKETPANPLDPDDVVYEPRSSRLLVRGLGENDMDEDEEDYESSARLLGMSFMNRSSSLRPNVSSYTRQEHSGSCSMPSSRTLVVGVFLLIVIASVAMVIYFLPRCTFTKEGCHKANATEEDIYPIASNGELFPWASQRLPLTIQPVHYELLIHPNLSTMTFQGKVSIQVNVLNDTKKIVMHSSDLQITKVTIQDKEVGILEYKRWQQIAIKFTEYLKAGQTYLLKFEYKANLSNGYSGFYNSSYTDKDGFKRVLAATQFEPLSARKAFPCFDEPAFKASFSVKINRDAEYISLSNMPKINTTELENGLQQDVFEKSRQMSTYLVAFIVANFSQINKTADGTLVSVYAVPDKVDQLNYALDSAVKLLEFFNEFLQIKFPLSKLDLVAIPDFLAGAMENWGLITFRETTLLLQAQSSLIDKQFVTSVIAHELSHQWFGNLVTMKWWNDLWLNEGLATYMEYISVETLFPELEAGNEFLSMRFKALEKDSLNSSHPVSTEATTPEQVEEMFDSVSYEKGASILLMLNSTLPGDKFHTGLTEYLKKYSWNNTDNEELWRSIPSDKSYSVAETMNTWTLQKGFPLVTVNRTGTQVILSQEPFVFTVDPTAKSSNLWHIPLTYVNDSCANSSACKQMFYLKDKKATLTIPDSVKWLKFNYGNDGFYVVQYDTKSLEQLISALTSSVDALTPADRASLLNNIFLLSRLGKVSFKQVINVLTYLNKEMHTAPLTEALFQLDRIYRLLQKRYDFNLVSRMKNRVFENFGNLMDSQSWEEEQSVSKQELRSSLLEIACRYDRQNCTNAAMAIFNCWVESNQTKRIPGDLQKVVFSVAAQSDSGWLTLLEAFSRSVVDLEKRKMLVALASSRDVFKIVGMLKDTLEGSTVQTQELPLVIHTVCKDFPGYLYAWDFVKENWEKITRIFPIGSFALQDIVISTTCQFSTERHLLEVQSFFASLKSEASEMRCVHEAVEMIKLNIQWMERNLDTMWHWL